LDHLLDAAHLALDPPQPLLQRLLVGHVAVLGPVGGGAHAASIPYPGTSALSSDASVDGLQLEFEDTFDGPALHENRWVPCYPPHWRAGREAAAGYEVGGGELVLRIDHDQPRWCPELDGGLRVSSLQTALQSGQHRFHADAVVREEQAPVRLYTPCFGRLEIR